MPTENIIQAVSVHTYEFLVDYSSLRIIAKPNDLPHYSPGI